MFSKGYNNIRSLIETQYGILSQMICDIPMHYQKELQKIKYDAHSIAKDNSIGDYEVYISILNSFDDVEYHQVNLLDESRKIVFCTIFSYYKTMLHGLLQYYKISSRAEQIEQVYDCILKSYKNRYYDEITIQN